MNWVQVEGFVFLIFCSIVESFYSWILHKWVLYKYQLISKESTYISTGMLFVTSMILLVHVFESISETLTEHYYKFNRVSNFKKYRRCRNEILSKMLMPAVLITLFWFCAGLECAQNLIANMCST